MKIKVGAYELNGTFESREDAEKVFLNDFPAVTPERLQTELNKHFKDGVDKSRNATEKNTDSEKSNSENSKGGTAKK